MASGNKTKQQRVAEYQLKVQKNYGDAQFLAQLSNQIFSMREAINAHQNSMGVMMYKDDTYMHKLFDELTKMSTNIEKEANNRSMEALRYETALKTM